MENPEEKPDKETLKKWHDDPANWKDELFYYNKKDKRLFPLKRYGGGWTTNFANWKSIAAIIILIVVGLVVVLFLHRVHILE